ncbi:unnamed protein product, partial [Brassica oleracea]
KKLRKICNAELVTVEVVKPPEKKPEPEKPTPDKPAEIVAFPVTQFNNPYQYHYSYANSYYQPCDNYRVVVEEPNTCAQGSKLIQFRSLTIEKTSMRLSFRIALLCFFHKLYYITTTTTTTKVYNKTKYATEAKRSGLN